MQAVLGHDHARHATARTNNSPSYGFWSTAAGPSHGIGPSGAARLLVEVGDVSRFANRAHFASWNEAMRALKRRLSDIVYRQLINDVTAATATGPGGQQETSTTPA
jgi:hypothetical protein